MSLQELSGSASNFPTIYVRSSVFGGEPDALQSLTSNNFASHQHESLVAIVFVALDILAVGVATVDWRLRDGDALGLHFTGVRGAFRFDGLGVDKMPVKNVGLETFICCVLK